MSLHFSANQYERNFKPVLLQNWEVPRNYRERMIIKGLIDCRPRAFLGFSQIVANDRGHLLAGVKRNRESPWGTFVGTYDMPLKIPGNTMSNSTARTEMAVHRLERLKSDGAIVLAGKLKQCNVPSPLPVKADKDADKILSPKGALGTTQLATTGSRNGERSGARNPAPLTSVGVPASPGIRTSLKPSTPNLDWPRPESQGRLAKSASPKMASPKSPLPAIGSPNMAPCTPTQTPLKWPSPREEPIPT